MDRQPRSHSIQNAVIAVVLLAEFIALIGHPLFGWGPRRNVFQATPRPLVYTAPASSSGQAVLLSLAAAAARAPEVPHTGRARYAYVERETWHVVPDARGHPISRHVLPSVTQSWLAPDGSGRVVTTTRGQREPTTSDVTLHAGPPLPRLSTNEAVLAHRLAPGDLGSAVPARQFAAITDLTAAQPVPPHVQAAILRLLARIGTLVDAGAVTDRDGRRGVAVRLDSAYTGVMIGDTLIFDPRTGSLLEADQTLIGKPPKNLDVPTGAVIAYTTILASGYAATTTAGP
jgi:hypothetical protein